ncbi:MAG: hypothetical protein OXG98_02155 [Gemmatimonadetes bacterium]|nr:hypothetical protein [Gemmatimonadota bacterium]
MNLWQTIKSELDGPIETVRKSLSGALDMAEDLTRKGRVKLEIQSARADIRNQLTELGGRVHQMVVEDGITDVSGDTEVTGILDRIKELQGNIADREEELRREDTEQTEKKAS